MAQLLASFVYYLITLSYISAQHENNVCKSFGDYYLGLDSNPNCFYNPDQNLLLPQIVERHGYPILNYTVTTHDGYILTLFRIPHGRASSNNQTKRPSLFLQHGIGTSSMCFIHTGRKALALVMADSGYDVWLGNFRGSIYSNSHLFLNYTDKRYWNFTVHELGVYDLSTQLDIVYKITNQPIIYMGHSLGSTAYFIYNSENPKEATKKIKLAVSLAPIAFLKHITTPLRVLAYPPLITFVKFFLESTTDGGLNQRTPQSIANRKLFCLPYPFQMHICSIPKYLLFGFDFPQEDPTTLPVSIIQGADATGVKVLEHLAQLVVSDRFQQYDYGRKKNKVVYGSETPPQYNLSNINLPNYFIRGKRDALATEKNVEQTYAALPSSAKPFEIYVIPYDKFCHMDFVIAKDVKNLLYNHIINFLEVNRNTF